MSVEKQERIEVKRIEFMGGYSQIVQRNNEESRSSPKCDKLIMASEKNSEWAEDLPS